MKRKSVIFLLVICIFLLGGCKDRGIPQGEGPFLYYQNTEGTNLMKEKYTFKKGSPLSQIREGLEKLKENPENEDYISVFTKDVSIQKEAFEEGIAKLYFSDKYNKLSKTQEVLLRSAIVQTLTQLDEVKGVEFVVGEKPLSDGKGVEIGVMKGEDFVQNIGSSIHSAEKANLTIFYGNEQGEKLVQKNISVRYNSNMSLEELVIQQLIKGPRSKNALKTIPQDTNLLSITTKENTCYINFNEGFLNNPLQINPEISIYSIVNSIIENHLAEKVQISVNGETNVSYQGVVDLSKPFSLNMEKVEGR